MIILRRKIYSGVGTQAIYKINRFLNPSKSNIQLARSTIKTKQVAEKVGHAVADRYAVTAAIAGPAVPVFGVSQGLALVYAGAPNIVRKIPVAGKLVVKAENSNLVKKMGKPVHKAVDYMFKPGRRP